MCLGGSSLFTSRSFNCLSILSLELLWFHPGQGLWKERASLETCSSISLPLKETITWLREREILQDTPAS